MALSGTIKTDASGTPYLDAPPHSKVVHIAYQDYGINDIGNVYDTLFSTDVKHMVSGINKLFNTNYQWDDLVGKTVEFFNPAKLAPFTKLRFEVVAGHYLATVVTDDVLWELSEEPASTLYTELGVVIDGGPSIYYGKESDGSDLELLKFTRLSYTTHELAANPALNTDFTLLLVDGDKLVTTKLNKYPLGASDSYTVLEFFSDTLPVTELIVDKDTIPALAKAVSHATGLSVTPDNFVTKQLIRVFDPSSTSPVDDELTIHTLRSGERVKYVLSRKDTPEVVDK